MPRAAFSQIVNRSMSEVLTRSLATSFCTLMPVTSLLIFGGETLKDFAFALLVGIASGAYSSIFIAGPVLTEWKEREPGYRPAPPAHHRGVRPRARLPRGDDRRTAAAAERPGRRAPANAPATSRSARGRHRRRPSSESPSPSRTGRRRADDGRGRRRARSRRRAAEEPAPVGGRARGAARERERGAGPSAPSARSARAPAQAGRKHGRRREAGRR